MYFSKNFSSVNFHENLFFGFQVNSYGYGAMVKLKHPFFLPYCSAHINFLNLKYYTIMVNNN